jgi:hypothetical protein
LRVVDLVAQVGVVHLQQVHHGEDLAIVGHKSLTDGVGAGYEGLEDFKSDSNNLAIAGVKSSYRTKKIRVSFLIRRK